MPVFHHIRFARSERFGEPELAAFEEPSTAPVIPASCPQNKFRLDFIMGNGEPTAQDEDCHFLSIYTPSREGRRPVLVWIHGGAYIAGSGEESAYDGSALSEEGDIVVVTVSYRLGVFGYLYNPEGAPQNLGLKDQLTALRWVHENISRFGGDPDRVTLAGQSAGGHSVAALISVCREPLFRKAIIQSAPLAGQFGEHYLAKQYRDFVRLLGKPVSEASTGDMLSAQTRLIAASGRTMSFSPNVPGLGEEMAVPSLEGVLLTWQKDDTSPFVAMRLNREERFGGMIDRLATRLSTWIVFKRCGRRYASFLRKHGVAVQTKELDWRPDGSPFGACHCLELPFLFGPWERWKDAGILHGISREEWEQRGRSLRRQWLDFIR